MRAVSSYQIYTGLGALIFVTLAVTNVFFGELNQDEGWYLYAARLASEGRVPYLDFAFTQGPLFPRIYAWFVPLVQRGGLGAARAFTALLAFFASALAAWAAARLVPSPSRTAAGVATWLLLTLNPYQSYFTTVVKTYSLASLFLAAGMAALAGVKNPRGAWHAFAAGIAIAAAAAVRLSAAAAGLAIALWLVLHRRQVARGAAISFVIGAAVCGTAVFGPYWFWAREGLLFGMFEYHAGRSAGEGWAFWLFRAGFISRTLLAYWPAVVAAWACRVWSNEGDEQKHPAAGNPSEALLWAATAMSAVHLFAPFPYDDYQVVAYPLFAAWLGVRLIPRRPAAAAQLPSPAPSDHRGERRRRLVWLTGLGLIGLLAAPANHQWAILRRDRIWWRTKSEPDLLVLRRAAEWLRCRIPENEPLLTQDLYLAVEAGRRVPQGFELGPFSYFPDLPPDRAERLRVLNCDLLLKTIARAEAGWAAFSGYGLSIAAPGVVELPRRERNRLEAALEQQYEWVREISDFGQAYTTLRIYRRRARLCD